MLIMCASPGRSGSQYLASLLDTARGVTARHEVPPMMIGPVLRAVAAQGERKTRSERAAIKVPHLTSAEKLHGIYAETNHMFLKTYHDLVLEEFNDVRVVVLRRDLERVLMSFVRLGYFRQGTVDWDDWMHDPWSMEGHLPPPFPRPDDPAERCLAYLVDIERRSAELLRENPDRCVEVRLEEISSLDGALSLFEHLGLSVTDETRRFAGTRVNARAGLKHSLGINFTETDARSVIDRHLQRYDEAGVARPELPHLSNRRSASDQEIPTLAGWARPRAALVVSPGGRDSAPVLLGAARRLVAVGGVDGPETRVRLIVPPEVMSGPHDGIITLPLLPDTRVSGVLAPTPDMRPEDMIVVLDFGVALRSDGIEILMDALSNGGDAVVVEMAGPAPLRSAVVQPTGFGHLAVGFRVGTLDALDLDGLLVGDEWGARVIAWNVAQSATHLVRVTDPSVAYRVGGDSDAALAATNTAAAYGVLERLLLSSAEKPGPVLLEYLEDLGLRG